MNPLEKKRLDLPYMEKSPGAIGDVTHGPTNLNVNQTFFHHGPLGSPTVLSPPVVYSFRYA